MPRSAPSVTSPHQASVDSFEPGCRDPRHDQGQGQVPLPAGRAEQRGQAELAGHRVHGGDVPVRQRPGDASPPGLAGRDEGLAFQRGLDRVDHVVRQLGQVRQGLVADLPAVAVGAAQQPGLVLPRAGPACRCASS